MPLTRPPLSFLNSNSTVFNDPLLVLHQGSQASDSDVGFVFNRANGLVANVALYWSEADSTFYTAYTNSGGATDANLVPTSYASLTTGTLNANNAVVTGNLTVSGTTTTINTTNSTISDSLIELNSGAGSNANDLGFIFERGSTGDNAIIAWDESADAFILGTTTATGASTGDLTVTAGALSIGSLTVSGNATFDTNTLYVDSSNNRVGIGTTSPAYQVEIENTGANALLVLDRTDGASTFIEGGATDSVIGSVGSNDVKIAYNSVPVVTIGAGGAITTSGNITAGNLRANNLTTQNAFAIVGSDNNLIQDTTLSVDPASNYLGINQTSPEVTLHMTGEGAQTTQIRMEQYNDSADAPDVRTRRYRGTIASPSAVQSGDYLFRSNHEYYNGTSLLVGGAFAFDNTNNANRTQFSVAVDIDGTGADPQGNNGQFKIDGNDSGAITFNNAYKFPTADGSANQVLQTDGSGALSFASVTADTTLLEANIGSFQTYANSTFSTSSTVDALDANVGTIVGTTIPTLDANVGTIVSTTIPTLDANLGTATTNITTLFANAASQASLLDVLSGNAVTQQSELATLVANAASQSSDLTTLLANAATQADELTVLTANAATQSGAIDSINANVGAFQTYANVNFSTIDDVIAYAIALG